MKRGMAVLIRADDRVELLEWTLLRIVERNVEGLRSVAGKYRLEALAEEVSLLLSFLARAGQGDPKLAGQAFAYGCAELAFVVPAFKSDGDLKALEAALQRLTGLLPLQKPQLLKAMARCIGHDGQVTAAEAELMRAVADIPLPDAAVTHGDPLMTPFIVRHASAADCVQLSHVACRTFAMACPASTPALEIARHIEGNLQPDHFGELLLQPGKIVLALEVDNQLIGYSLLTLDPEPVGIELADGVRSFPLLRGARISWYGAAGFLMNESLKHLTGPVRLSVSEENSRAIRFYQRQGFRIVGETYFQCGDERQRDWLMLRD